MKNVTHQTDNRLLLQHAFVLFAGFVIGLAAAYGLSLLPLSPGGDVEAARRLGIVSLTVLEGYSKNRDIVNYGALVILPPFVALLLWFFWSRGERAQRLGLLFDGNGRVGSFGNGRWLLAVVACAILVFSFNINYFYKPIAGWTFLGEEGINLFAVASILRGGVFSLDFSTGYGPMLIYPLALLMKLAGATLLTDRIYTYLLNLLAYGIVTLFFYRTMRSRKAFVISSLAYVVLFHPFVAVSPNTTYLRVALGFLPLMLAIRYTETGSRRLLWLCGAVAGQSLLFSQEVAICTVVSLGAVLFLNDFSRKTVRQYPAELLQVGCAAMLSAAPLLGYLAVKGALPRFLFELVYYPKLYSMGYSALKFPTLTTLFTEPIAGQALFPYWLIAVYLVAALWLLPQLAMGKTGSRNLTETALLVMGLLLFRSALCRSDFYHLFFVAQPAFVLLFLMLDRAMAAGDSAIVPGGAVRRWVSVMLLVLFALVPALVPGYRNYVYRDFATKGLNPVNKWQRQEAGYQLLVNRTGGVPIGEELVDSVAKIRSFLARNSSPDEYVYFYPNEAGYYFLLDRRNPTRYAFSYQAITAEQRREIIGDLERKKPRFVIYSRRVWLVDNIQPAVQVPELHAYLGEHYLPFEDLDEILVMKRKEL